MPDAYAPEVVGDERFLVRLWSKVVIGPEFQDLGPCLFWTGATQTAGYGQIGLGKPCRPRLTHRASYVLANGPVPDGLVLDHLCRTPICVAPLHLDPVTQQINTLRGDAAMSANHCSKGHEMTPENTMTKKDGARRCRKCQYSYNTALLARKRSE